MEGGGKGRRAELSSNPSSSPLANPTHRPCAINADGDAAAAAAAAAAKSFIVF